LDFQVGFYESVEGLGQNPGQVVINGTIDSWNQCVGGSRPSATRPRTLALDLEPDDQRHGSDRCNAGEDVWAVSQAAPDAPGGVQRNVTLMDYAGGPRLGQRRVHRGLRAERHGAERLPAAVDHQEHHYRQLDQRGVEQVFLR